MVSCVLSAGSVDLFGFSGFSLELPYSHESSSLFSSAIATTAPFTLVLQSRLSIVVQTISLKSNSFEYINYHCTIVNSSALAINGTLFFGGVLNAASNIKLEIYSVNMATQVSKLYKLNSEKLDLVH